MYTRQRWQDWVNLFLGLSLFFTPMFVAPHVFGAAAWSSYIFGAIIALISAMELSQPDTWEEWINLVIGLWLVAAPFVLGYRTGSMLMWNSVIVGFLIAADALWASISQSTLTHREHSHHA